MKPRFGSAMEDLLAKVDHMKRAWSQNNEDHDVYSFPLCNNSPNVLQTSCKSLNASGFSGKISGITKMEVHLCKAYTLENRETPPPKTALYGTVPPFLAPESFDEISPMF